MRFSYGVVDRVGALDPLDELRHANVHAMAQRPRHHAKGGRGFALAVAGQHQQQTFFLVRASNIGIDQGFLFGHARGVAFGFVGHRISIFG